MDTEQSALSGKRTAEQINDIQSFKLSSSQAQAQALKLSSFIMYYPECLSWTYP